MTLDLTEEETAALARLLTNTIDADRYPLCHHAPPDACGVRLVILSPG
ncbi:MAG: hypothetical protein WCA23_11870 [Stellaceae bacterium]